ncbi:hypothetical protein JXB27_03175 [Candidatus Woesearchaeota archaeon]|nr:hypothetical protein [Candidatus Woesearchaeota archaeon]
MYNVKSSQGTYKGNIGEFMFALAKKSVFITKFHGKEKYFFVVKKHLTKEQQEFLFRNWYSIDAIEVGFNQCTIYEIKTQSHLEFRPTQWKPKSTERSLAVYEKAKSIGFCVKLAIVEFHENWSYDVLIKDFSEELVCVDKPKKYDSIFHV